MARQTVSRILDEVERYLEAGEPTGLTRTERLGSEYPWRDGDFARILDWLKRGREFRRVAIGVLLHAGQLASSSSAQQAATNLIDELEITALGDGDRRDALAALCHLGPLVNQNLREHIGVLLVTETARPGALESTGLMIPYHGRTSLPTLESRFEEGLLRVLNDIDTSEKAFSKDASRLLRQAACSLHACRDRPYPSAATTAAIDGILGRMLIRSLGETAADTASPRDSVATGVACWSTICAGALRSWSAETEEIIRRATTHRSVDVASAAMLARALRHASRREIDAATPCAARALALVEEVRRDGRTISTPLETLFAPQAMVLGTVVLARFDRMESLRAELVSSIAAIDYPPIRHHVLSLMSR